jgi:hypothetical protein
VHSPCPWNIILGIKNLIPGFPASPKTSRWSPSLSSSQDCQPTPMFLSNAKFLLAFPSQHIFNSSPSSRCPFWPQS